MQRNTVAKVNNLLRQAARSVGHITLACPAFPSCLPLPLAALRTLRTSPLARPTNTQRHTGEHETKGNT
jgi:hypothetical protein